MFRGRISTKKKRMEAWLCVCLLNGAGAGFFFSCLEGTTMIDKQLIADSKAIVVVSIEQQCRVRQTRIMIDRIDVDGDKKLVVMVKSVRRSLQNHCSAAGRIRRRLSRQLGWWEEEQLQQKIDRILSSSSMEASSSLSPLLLLLRTFKSTVTTTTRHHLPFLSRLVQIKPCTEPIDLKLKLNPKSNLKPWWWFHELFQCSHLPLLLCWWHFLRKL